MFGKFSRTAIMNFLTLVIEICETFMKCFLVNEKFWQKKPNNYCIPNLSLLLEKPKRKIKYDWP